MRVLAWFIATLIALVGGFYAFNSYIYNEKQGDTIMQNSTVTVHPISHASLVLTWGDKTIYADPVGSSSLYAQYPNPSIVLVTHIHADHFSTTTLLEVVGPNTTLVAPQSVADQLPETLKKNLIVMKNNDVQTLEGLTIQAIPAYNQRPEALKYHPQGRDNGYVLEGGDTRVYIAGDTEGTPEMRALEGIDIAFVPMNLPYTMSVEDAATAVLAFKPASVYPYHYDGQNGQSDINRFKELVNAGNPAIEVELKNWYP